MKKILTLAAVLMTTIALFAQEKKDVTKFLGIPVDGYKSEMISKLKAKGFTSTSRDKNILEGEFNGQDVELHVVTNNNKVYRIYLADKNHVSESDIRIRFNNLLNQFKNNSKYFGRNEHISEDEDLGYNITVKDKRYQAIFYQVPEASDSIAIQKELESVLEKKYGVKKVEDLSEEKQNEAREYLGIYNVYRLFGKTVWFMISEYYGKYYISMFYDNELNKANGEDL